MRFTRTKNKDKIRRIAKVVVIAISKAVDQEVLVGSDNRCCFPFEEYNQPRSRVVDEIKTPKDFNSPDSMRGFQFTRALVRAIDPTLAKQALRLDGSSAAQVNMAVAHQQHANMVDHLKRIGLVVTELPSDGLADSVFVEDTVVIANDVAMITVPGAVSRRPETRRIKQTLLDLYKDSINVVQQESGVLDGGDVLFTGLEFFVGISERTDLAGIASLQAAFPKFKVNPIDISVIGAQHGVLHLKSACSMCGDGHVLTGGAVGTAIAKEMERTSPHRYRYSHVVDAAASNCVYVNGHLLRRSGGEFPQSGAALTAVGGRQIEVEASELAKVDGALTCCSVLF